MALAIATHKALLRYDNGAVDVWGMDGSYGCLAYDPGHEAIFVTCQEEFAQKLDAKFMGDPVLLVYGEDGKIIDRRRVDGITGVHMAYFDEESGHMFVCHSPTNQVLISTPFTQKPAENLNVGTIREDVNHINSVRVHGDLMYLMLHNGAALDPTVKSAILCLKWKESEIQWFEWLLYRGCHDVEVDGDVLYYNASEDGRTCRVNRESGVTDELIIGGHSKGMWRLDEETMVVGSSVNSKYHEDRRDSYCDLVYIDLKKWEVKERETILLANRSAGQINEIVQINE